MAAAARSYLVFFDWDKADLTPRARQIIAESTQNAGFPPLLLDGIDFGAAYLAQLQAQQKQGDEAGQPTGDVTPPEDDQSPSA